MNQMRDLIAVFAGPVRLAALGVLSAGLAAGATFVLVDTPGRPLTPPALSIRTSEGRPPAPTAQPSAQPTAPPEAQPQEPAPRPPAPASSQASTPTSEQDDSGEPAGDD